MHVDAPNGRFAEGASLLDGRMLLAIDAYGKHLLYDFGDERWLHVHLGLFGKFRSGAMPYPPMQGALRVRIWTDAAWLELRGPTACEVIDDADRRRLLARIGPDPLRAHDRPARAVERITASRAQIGTLLMDQSVIAGIGNVYRAELLFRAKLNPYRLGTSIEPAAIVALWRDSRAVMRDGVRDRRMVTTKPKDRPHRTGVARRDERHYVYHRTGRPCFICGTEIEQALLATRKVYWCPHCQP